MQASPLLTVFGSVGSGKVNWSKCDWELPMLCLRIMIMQSQSFSHFLQLISLHKFIVYTIYMQSTLLQVLLSELQPSSGRVNINGRLSYTSQEPWLFSASLRDNILFGNEYDPVRYNAVIDACALKKVRSMQMLNLRTSVRFINCSQLLSRQKCMPL